MTSGGLSVERVLSLLLLIGSVHYMNEGQTMIAIYLAILMVSFDLGHIANILRVESRDD